MGLKLHPTLFRARIERLDPVDRQILSLLLADGRRSYQDIGRQVHLSAPSVKRRVDALRASGALRGFTAIVDPEALGWHTEAMIELFYAPGTLLNEVADSLAHHPEVIEAWSVTGDADAIARVRTVDNLDLERLIMAFQQDGRVVRTRSLVVMSRLISTPPAQAGVASPAARLRSSSAARER